jgi:hypothetical protein
MVGRVANAPPTALPVDCSCMAAICVLGITARGAVRATAVQPPGCNDNVEHSAVEKIASNLIRFS